MYMSERTPRRSYRRNAVQMCQFFKSTLDVHGVASHLMLGGHSWCKQYMTVCMTMYEEGLSHFPSGSDIMMKMLMLASDYCSLLS